MALYGGRSVSGPVNQEGIPYVRALYHPRRWLDVVIRLPFEGGAAGDSVGELDPIRLGAMDGTNRYSS